jgi:quercetin dioxygenase-like cupin family protein
MIQYRGIDVIATYRESSVGHIAATTRSGELIELDIRDERDEQVTVLVTGEQTQGRFALVETVVSRTQELPLHSHTQEDEFIYVVDGEVTIHIDGGRLECAAGDHAFLPKGSEHTYCIRSPYARLLVLLMPAGLEGYYQELGRPVDANQYVEWLITVSARYGVSIKGPGR